MTAANFQQQMDRMTGLKYAPTDLTTHWEALRDLPEPVLAAAVGYAQRMCVDFPTPRELREFADVAKPDAGAAVEDRSTVLAQPYEITVPFVSKPIRIEREWTYYCATCEDGGWETLFCGDPLDPHKMPWVDSYACERHFPHSPHEWARQCRCYASNHAIQSRLERQRKYAAERVKK